MTELIDRMTETDARPELAESQNPVFTESQNPLVPVAAEPHPVFVDLTGRRRRGMRAIGFLAATACTAYVAAVGMTLSAERTGVGSDTVLEMITDAPGDVFEQLRDGAASLLDLWPDAVPASGPVLVALPATPAIPAAIPGGTAALAIPPAASVTAPAASLIAPVPGTLAPPGRPSRSPGGPPLRR